VVIVMRLVAVVIMMLMIVVMRVVVAIARIGIVMRTGCLVHDELGGRHACTKHPARRDLEPRHRQAAERALQLAERKAGVEHRAEGHVA